MRARSAPRLALDAPQTQHRSAKVDRPLVRCRRGCVRGGNAGAHEFAITGAGFDTTVLGMQPAEFGAGDQVLFVEYELLAGDRASFEGLEILLSDGRNGSTSLPPDEAPECRACSSPRAWSRTRSQRRRRRVGEPSLTTVGSWPSGALIFAVPSSSGGMWSWPHLSMCTKHPARG